MNVPGRIFAFAAGLLVVFAGAVGIGSLVEPADTGTGAAHEEEGGHAAGVHGEGAPLEEALSLRLAPTFLDRGEGRELRFSIAGADGAALRDFDELHERRMHLIVVRRDGTGFRHLHPEMDKGGTWRVPVAFAAAGVYRAFADFSVAGERHTLASDLFVSGGSFEARPFPPPAPLDSTAGYEVRLRGGDRHAGEPSSLNFAVSRDGEAVDDLAPYLGAEGHLVALREGDLTFLHVHPEESGAEEIAFAATFPTPGRYRLYLQFRHEGVVRTAEFTVSVSR